MVTTYQSLINMEFKKSNLPGSFGPLEIRKIVKKKPALLIWHFADTIVRSARSEKVMAVQATTQACDHYRP